MDNKFEEKLKIGYEEYLKLPKAECSGVNRESSLESNIFNFQKGKINIIKSSTFDCKYIKGILENTISNCKYLLVGGMYGMPVTNFNELIESLTHTINDNYIVVITDMPQIIGNCLKNNLLVNIYNADIKRININPAFVTAGDITSDKLNTTGDVLCIVSSPTYDEQTLFTIKGNKLDFKCPLEDIESNIRDLKINELI